MKIAVLGQVASDVGTVASRRPGVSQVVAVDADDPLTGAKWLGVVVSGDADGAVRLARTALSSGCRVLAVDVPAEDVDWRDLAAGAPDGLTLSRPLRFDPHIARASDLAAAGSLGVPRTLEIVWSFSNMADIALAAGELVDVACHLLAGSPAAVYALGCEVAGPPLVKMNLLVGNGAVAVLEAAGESANLPARRDLHLIATDGEIVHRLGNDDLLWSDGRVTPLPGATSLDELRGQEVAAWIDDGSAKGRMARGPEVAWNLAVARAVSRSLATGEVVSVSEEVGRS